MSTIPQVIGKPLIKGSPGITGSWIPRAPMKGFWWHLHVGSSLNFPLPWRRYTVVGGEPAVMLLVLSWEGSEIQSSPMSVSLFTSDLLSFGHVETRTLDSNSQELPVTICKWTPCNQWFANCRIGNRLQAGSNTRPKQEHSLKTKKPWHRRPMNYDMWRPGNRLELLLMSRQEISRPTSDRFYLVIWICLVCEELQGW